MHSNPPISAAMIEEQILRLRMIFHCENDKELATALGLDPTAVSAWRRRGRIPAKYLLKGRAHADLFVATNGVVSNFYSLRASYTYALLSVASIKIFDQYGSYQEQEYYEIWAGFSLAKLHRYIEGEFRTKVGMNLNDELRRLYEELREKVSSDDLMKLIEELPETLV